MRYGTAHTHTHTHTHVSPESTNICWRCSPTLLITHGLYSQPQITHRPCKQSVSVAVQGSLFPSARSAAISDSVSLSGSDDVEVERKVCQQRAPGHQRDQNPQKSILPSRGETLLHILALLLKTTSMNTNSISAHCHVDAQLSSYASLLLIGGGLHTVRTMAIFLSNAATRKQSSHRLNIQFPSRSTLTGPSLRRSPSLRSPAFVNKGGRRRFRTTFKQCLFVACRSPYLTGHDS